MKITMFMFILAATLCAAMVTDGCWDQKNRTPDIRPYNYSKYGYRVSGKFGEDRGGVVHLAIDYSLNYGTSINATAEGEVIWSAMCGRYGYLIIIDHQNGYRTYYAHLSKPYVIEGEQVDKGQIIALSGDSGNVKAHLHFSCLKQGVGFVFPYRKD